jgi:hypothetical protein
MSPNTQSKLSRSSLQLHNYFNQMALREWTQAFLGVNRNRKLRMGFILWTCFFINPLSLVAACTNFSTPIASWDSNMGNRFFDVQQTGQNITGKFSSSCGNIDYTGTIDSQGQIDLYTTVGCSVSNPTQQVSGTIHFFNGGQPSWNWVSNGNYPDNCDSVILYWIGFGIPSPPSGQLYLMTYATGETPVPPSPTEWDQMVYQWKSTVTGAVGRKFAGRYFFEEDATPAQPINNDTCWFTGSAVSLEHVTLNFGAPSPGEFNWEAKNTPLAADSSWIDRVGVAEYYVGYYRARSPALQMADGSCLYTVGQTVYMVADFRLAPTYNAAFWTTGWAKRPYKSNWQSYTITATDPSTYFDGFNGGATWHVYNERRDFNTPFGNGPFISKFWPKLHPPGVVVASSSATHVTLNFTHVSTNEANGYVIERTGGGGNLEHKLFPLQQTWTDNLITSSDWTYCVRAAHHADFWNPQQITQPMKGPCATVGGLQLAANPNSRPQGECFLWSVANGANMTLDMQYTFRNGPLNTVSNWFTTDSNGEFQDCTNGGTPLGDYSIYGIRNAAYPSAPFTPVNVTITVYAPLSLSVSPNSLPQGQCFLWTIGNGANMTLAMQYTYPGGSLTTVPNWATTDSNGQFWDCTNGYTLQGDYTIYGIRNAADPGAPFTPVNVTITVT